MSNKARNPRRSLDALTEKQREALDLLSSFMTSKEISRELGISPHTVDQRIDGARRRLGARNRRELVQAYRELVQISEQMTYEESGIATTPKDDNWLSQDEPGNPARLVSAKWTKALATDGDGSDYRVGPKLLNGRFATIYRIIAILLVAVLGVIALLGAVAIYVQLSELLGK